MDKGIYQLTYRDGAGEDTERLISDIAAEGVDTITAHCHLRDARRTFKLLNILRLVDTATGEVISDPWSLFGAHRLADGADRAEKQMAGKVIQLDPLAHFSTWQYDIRPELWRALGVERREYVNRAETRRLREAARATGETDKGKLGRLRATFFASVVATPADYDFHEGDIFRAYPVCTPSHYR